MRKLLYTIVLGIFISPMIAGNQPEGNFSSANDIDQYYMGLKFVMDSQCDLTNKYFNIDYSDLTEEEAYEEATTDENIYLLSIQSGHHPSLDLTIKKISHQRCYHGHPSSSEIECVFEKGKLVWINAVCDSLIGPYDDPESERSKCQYRYYFDKKGNLMECRKKEVHGTLGKEDSLLTVFKGLKFSQWECKGEWDDFLMLIKDILDYLEKNK